MRISDWSSDVCSSDLSRIGRRRTRRWWSGLLAEVPDLDRGSGRRWLGDRILRRMAANTLVLLGGKAVGGLLSLATMALAVRALGLEGYGVLVLIHTFAVAVASVGKFQSWQAVLRYGAPALAAGRPEDLVRLVRLAR